MNDSRTHLHKRLIGDSGISATQLAASSVCYCVRIGAVHSPRISGAMYACSCFALGTQLMGLPFLYSFDLL